MDFWRERKRAWGLPDELPFGSLGENLTISGLLEESLYVGDVLDLPDCSLRVTQPRFPCYKFTAVMGRVQAARSMMRSGFSGFYLAVDRPGTLAAGQSFTADAGSTDDAADDDLPAAWSVAVDRDSRALGNCAR